MGWQLSSQEFAALLLAPPPKRYSYFVKHAADEARLWSLRSPTGWVVAATDSGREIHPVWPHLRFAEACATNEWTDASAEPIPVQDWLVRWTPGMVQAGRAVAVFPTPDDRGTLVEPGDLAADLEEELSLIE
jgi:hypothetical protein